IAYTERLKLQKSPILGTLVTPKVISPVCDCPTGSASIAFRLRHADHLTITIEDSSGRSVRTLFSDRAIGDGPQTFFWDGRLADGRLAPDGAYRANLELDD